MWKKYKILIINYIIITIIIIIIIIIFLFRQCRCWFRTLIVIKWIELYVIFGVIIRNSVNANTSGIWRGGGRKDP
jgi:hypothetical protein